MKTARMFRRLRRDERAVSPAISTAIITGAVVVMVLVAMVYANGFLNTRLAENEFATNKQFMLTASLQIDDIAWTIGRTQTIRYSSRFGNVNFESNTLSYEIEVFSGGSWHSVFTRETGIVLYNMPTSFYTLGNDYFERVFPSNGSFLQQGPSAPVSHVNVVEKLPMEGGSFTRVVVVPTIRVMNSTIDTLNYVKFYLPLLVDGESPRLSQSLTFMGKEVTRNVQNAVTQVRITVTYPSESQGYDSQFFNFESQTEVFSLASSSVIEFYIGEVAVSLGLHA